MNTAINLRTSVPRSYQDLTVVLIDEISEAVASPPDAHARSAAICSLVREVYETMEWLHGVGAENEELDSLRRVVTEAQEHQKRMSALRDETGPVAEA